MDNLNVNFQGGFLIKKSKIGQIMAELPKRKCIIPEINDMGDTFVAVKDIYDLQMVNLLSKHHTRYKYYPDINLKARLDSNNIEAARRTVNSQTNILEKPKDILNFLKTVRKQFVAMPVYKWKPNDHIDKTFKALALEPENYTVKIKNGITYIYKKKDKKLVAKASPNSNRGYNYVYELPKNGDCASRKLAIDNDGKIVWEYPSTDLKTFIKNFMQAVKIDNGRIRPQK